MWYLMFCRIYETYSATLASVKKIYTSLSYYKPLYIIEFLVFSLDFIINKQGISTFNQADSSLNRLNPVFFKELFTLYKNYKVMILLSYDIIMFLIIGAIFALSINDSDNDNYYEIFIETIIFK